MKIEDEGVFFFASKKNTKNRKKKCREGKELTFLLLLLHLGWTTPLAFSSPRSFNVGLSTFMSPWSSVLFKLKNSLCSRDGISEKWSEGGTREVRRGGGRQEGKFWGGDGDWKILVQGKIMCFWFIPKIVWMASSSTSDCWFTLAQVPIMWYIVSNNFLWWGGNWDLLVVLLCGVLWIIHEWSHVLEWYFWGAKFSKLTQRIQQMKKLKKIVIFRDCFTST